MRRMVAGLAVAVAATGAVACQSSQVAEDESTRSLTGTIVEGGDVGVFSLQTGDCVDSLPSEERAVSSLEGVRCDVPHEGQVYAAYDVTVAEFPGDDAMDGMAFDGCMDRIPVTVQGEWGVNASYGPFIMQPTSESWQLGDREVICMVVRVDGGPITGDLL